MSTVKNLPQWDMSVYFPSLSSAEFDSACQQLVMAIDAQEERFDELCISKKQGPTTLEDVSIFEEILTKRNKLAEDLRLVNAYVSGFTTTDSRNEVAHEKESELDSQMVRNRKLGKRFIAWLGSLDLEFLLANSELARDHKYALEKTAVAAQHLMEPALEGLASDLELTGVVAWGKLHGNVTSQLEVSLDIDGSQQRLPMSAVRSFAYDKDRNLRRDAYLAEFTAWKGAETPIAAAMNSIKGEVSLLSHRRGWDSPLDEALFGANIDRPTLDAMLSASKAAFPIFRRYLKAKARVLGVEKLAFFDLFAPLGTGEREWEYHEAADFVVDQFTTYSSKLGDFAARNFKENWIDVGSRPGKRDGAFCMGVRREESRILLNFKPSFGAVSTLAHELGHGYHNLCLAERTPWQKSTPMTLAETASIFCETIVRQAVLDTGTPEEKLTVLEASLQGTTQVVVDITSRFLFEKAVFDQRAKRELSAKELCDLMRKAQIETYGDGLDPEFLHPYMWAAKPHYYGRSFYNFPYMFGLLFGLGLYAIYQKEPDSFHARYDELLSSTGLADAATLAAGFGIDIRSSEFWEASLAQIEQDVVLFEQLTA
jgi:pepF/M3 family oligoendopeptidase